MADVSAATAGAGKRRSRVYETWQGNERFFFWGFLMAGPNWKAVFGTAFLVAAPAGIFLAFVAPYLLFHVHVVLMVFAAILPALSLLFLFMTACRDPGVIPRQEADEEYLAGRKPRTKEVFVNNQRVLIRYNDTCHFYQPPRAHHCSVNDNCVERFDHHCPWVGTTIGRRNYRTFLLFIYTTTVLCLYVAGCCLAQLFVKHNRLSGAAQAAGNTDNQWGKTISQTIPAIVLLAYAFLFFWFVGGLSMFHCYLVGTNQTTYENFRYNHDSRPNPYSRGLWGNCAEVWCTPVPPSQIDVRAYADEVARRPPPFTGVSMPDGQQLAGEATLSSGSASPSGAAAPYHDHGPPGQAQYQGVDVAAGDALYYAHASQGSYAQPANYPPTAYNGVNNVQYTGQQPISPASMGAVSSQQVELALIPSPQQQHQHQHQQYQQQTMMTQAVHSPSHLAASHTQNGGTPWQT